MKQAILVVSFGTAVPRARDDIEAVETELRALRPQLPFYRAFTSPRIRRILADRGETIPSLENALEQMQRDGITDAAVQPTHILYGYEYDKIRKTVEKFRPQFERIQLGAPLFSCTADILETAAILDGCYPAEDEKRFVFMGHGTGHFADLAYPALETALHRRGRNDCFLTTVEGWPDFESVCRFLKDVPVTLVPLMLVAGDHALHDMAGDDPDSLKSMLESEGCRVSCVQRGLGSVPEIRRMYARHLKALLDAEE